MSAMAGIYVDVISPLGPRIQVAGLPGRSAKSAGAGPSPRSLLAGIRAAVLWHQVGGGHTTAYLSRHRRLTQAKQILAHLTWVMIYELSH